MAQILPVCKLFSGREYKSFHATWESFYKWNNNLLNVTPVAQIIHRYSKSVGESDRIKATISFFECIFKDKNSDTRTAIQSTPTPTSSLYCKMLLEKKMPFAWKEIRKIFLDMSLNGLGQKEIEEFS